MNGILVNFVVKPICAVAATYAGIMLVGAVKTAVDERKPKKDEEKPKNENLITDFYCEIRDVA